MTDHELRLEPLVGEALTAWLDASRQAYVAERIEAGDTPTEAEANAAASFERLVPQGTLAAGQHLGHLVDAQDVVVGHLWMGPMGSDPTRWWVWDVAIQPNRRGHGYGRAAMELAERLAQKNGASSIGLNVFAHNQVARDLYSSLGYVDTAVTMRKQLFDPDRG